MHTKKTRIGNDDDYDVLYILNSRATNELFFKRKNIILFHFTFPS